jgi:hypothetical protein
MIVGLDKQENEYSRRKWNVPITEEIAWEDTPEIALAGYHFKNISSGALEIVRKVCPVTYLKKEGQAIAKYKYSLGSLFIFRPYPQREGQQEKDNVNSIYSKER